ncbi:hypothetical protein [Halobaculum lipolyticum]|uniref:hypothetical protein n=1 Tax=Halobaculum lipolyticum TaxID=3032001 RepID=UPI0024C320EB|nr:hypothetical protein [Halobaculum sp. DT31]
MWVVGHRETTQWTFRLQTSKATQSVPIGSLGGVIKWSLFNIFIYVIGVAGGLVVLDAKVMRKVARGPQWGALEYGFLGFATLFLGGFVFYAGIMDTLARRPQLLGVLGGVFIGDSSSTPCRRTGSGRCSSSRGPRRGRCYRTGRGRGGGRIAFTRW